MWTRPAGARPTPDSRIPIPTSPAALVFSFLSISEQLGNRWQEQSPGPGCYPSTTAAMAWTMPQALLLINLAARLQHAYVHLLSSSQHQPNQVPGDTDHDTMQPIPSDWGLKKILVFRSRATLRTTEETLHDNCRRYGWIMMPEPEACSPTPVPRASPPAPQQSAAAPRSPRPQGRAQQEPKPTTCTERDCAPLKRQLSQFSRSIPMEYERLRRPEQAEANKLEREFAPASANWESLLLPGKV